MECSEPPSQTQTLGEGTRPGPLLFRRGPTPVGAEMLPALGPEPRPVRPLAGGPAQPPHLQAPQYPQLGKRGWRGAVIFLLHTDTLRVGSGGQGRGGEGGGRGRSYLRV